MKFGIKLHEDNEEWMPEKAHASDAGFDLKARAYCDVDDPVVGDEVEFASETVKMLQPGKRILVKTGVSIGLIPGWEAQVRPRSGNALKSGITVTNSPGTIDAGYRNEIGVILQNTSRLPFAVGRGSKVAQLVVKKVPEVELCGVSDLDDTDRGLGGFGSTGG